MDRQIDRSTGRQTDEQKDEHKVFKLMFINPKLCLKYSYNNHI